ncbi:MAG TPA: hypothetical protein VFV07_14105, partial [Rhizomicrobium sp.]|nr:hypothetical protein [Rhizomicrobium sp.]
MILHALAVAVIGFFVLFAAERASGIVKLVGTVLGWLLWILAIAGVVCAVIGPDMAGKWMDRMHGTPPAAAEPAKPEAAPATPAPVPATPAPAPAKPK